MNVLIMCTGNICRSQLAAAYLGRLLEEHRIEDVTIETAGIQAVKNAHIPTGVREVAQEALLTLGHEFGTQINLAMLQRADIILVMEYAQASFLLDMYPKILPRVHIIGKYDPQKSLNKEIHDPASFDYKHCAPLFNELKRCLDGFFFEEIMNRVGPTNSQQPSVDSEDDDPFNFDFSFN